MQTNLEVDISWSKNQRFANQNSVVKTQYKIYILIKYKKKIFYLVAEYVNRDEVTQDPESTTARLHVGMVVYSIEEGLN